jgi:energy-coupling factor transporter ATP-binding protein EcfA2
MARAPLRIARLEIHDLRAIERVSIDLRDAFDRPASQAVFVGPNGSGKTTALEAILLALGRLDLLPEGSASLNEQVRFGAEDFQIDVDLAEPDGTLALEISVGALSCMGDFDDDTKGRTLVPYNHRRSSLRQLNPAIAYLPSRRDHDAIGAAPDPAGSTRPANQPRLAEAKRALIGLYNRAVRAKTPMSPQSPFMRLQAFWQEFAEDDRVLDVIAASENPADGDEVVLREPRTVPDDITSLAMARARSAERTDIPSMVPLEHLSDGQRAVLRFASVLLFSDRPLDLLLIDEPERNLHPRWHHRLLPSLRALAPDTQILVATHSPDVVASVQSYERFSFGDESRFGVAVPDAAE